MHDLSPLTALGRIEPARETHGSLTLAETPDSALASLALRNGDAASCALGVALPAPGHWAEGPVNAIWMGPEQWLIEAPGQAETGIAHALADDAPGASVTDQTDAWVVFDITSDSAAALESLLEVLVNLDPAQLGPGRAVPTLLHHQRVLLVRRGVQHLSVFGTRSAAGSMWHALIRAARLSQV